MFHKLLLRMSVNFMTVLMIVLLVLGRWSPASCGSISSKAGWRT